MIKTWIATLPFLLFGCGEVKEKEPKMITEPIIEKSEALKTLERIKKEAVAKLQSLKTQLEQAKKITNEDLHKRVTDKLNEKLDWEVKYIGILEQNIKDQKELDSLGIDVKI